jgi:two-component system sensor histidine kinase DesK
VWLARTGGDLICSRQALAEAAVREERLRFSRELHDILGHDLAAIALRGELAMRLIPQDPHRARDEIERMTDMARNAIADVRAVARGYCALSLQAEIDNALGLLAAAGIKCASNITDVPNCQAGAEAFAWAVREGTTNILLHSDARDCVIRTTAEDGMLCLELINSGVRYKGQREGALSNYSVPRGRGLTGLSERMSALGGRVTCAVDGDGSFWLRAELPAGRPGTWHQSFARQDAAEGAVDDQGPDRRGHASSPGSPGGLALARAGH